MLLLWEDLRLSLRLCIACFKYFSSTNRTVFCRKQISSGTNNMWLEALVESDSFIALKTVKILLKARSLLHPWTPNLEVRT